MPPHSPTQSATDAAALLATADTEARALALAQLEDQFVRWRMRAPQFAESLTRPKTRLALLERTGKDWLYANNPAGPSKGRVEELVRDKFSAHLLSERDLLNAVALALDRYTVESAARTHVLIAEGKVPPETPVAGLDHLPALARTLLDPPDENWGGESVQSMISSGVSAEVAAVLLSKLALNITQAAATQVATQGSATAAGAAAGGTGGSAVAPGAGTVIGFGVGVVAGIAVDVWMTNRFESDVTAAARTYLNQLEYDLFYGNTKQALVPGEWPGIIGLLEAAAPARSTHTTGDLP